MIKNILKYLIIFIMGLFFLLFFFGENIYQNWITEKRDLTNEQIEKFEKDVKNGEEIDINDYIVKDKDYSNTITKINRKISDTINKGFKNFFKYLLKNIDV